MNIDNKIDAIVVDYKDNCRVLIATSVQNKLNKYIKVLEVKKV